MAVVGTLTVDLVANTASFEGGMKKSSDTARRSSKEIQESFNNMNFHEARGGLMLFDDLIGVHMPRHAAAFVSQIPGFAAAFAAMFPVVAVLVAIEAIAKATEHVKKHREEMEKAGREALDNALAFTKHAEALHISNLKLQDQVAILSHKLPQNAVQIAMEEGKQATTNLIAEFQKAIDKETELLGKQEQGFFNKLFFGDQGTNEVVQKAAEYRKEIDAISTNLRLARATPGKEKEADGFKKQLDNELEAYKKYLSDQSKAIDNEINERVSSFYRRAFQSSVPISQDQLTKGVQGINQEYTRAKQNVLELTLMLQSMSKAEQDQAAINIGNIRKGSEELKHAAEAEEERQEKMANEFSKKEEEHKKKVQARAEAEAKLSNAGAEALSKMMRAEEMLDQKQASADKIHQQGADRIAQLMRDISDQGAIQSQRMVVATGKMTEQKAVQEALKTLEHNKADALADVNHELDAQIAKVKALSADTFGGMSGSAEQKAQYERAVSDYQAMEIRKLQITKQFNAQIDAENLKLANNERSQWNKMALDFAQTQTHISQVSRQTIGSMNSSLASFIVTGQGNFRQFAATAISSFIQIGLEYLESRIIMAAADAFFGQSKDKQAANTLATNASMALSAAGLSAANTLAFTSALFLPPIPEGLSAAAFATGMTYAGFAAAE
ncbi:MAG TPA: phage tail tape measure C-terminal domain-containing protein, partial [Candidatus Angelobacter sp.]|nr:phage tail tape measure C-terminal domain-containing protein [Candidatus Angelobacter sp.]